jgi:hypothetical protein
MGIMKMDCLPSINRSERKRRARIAEYLGDEFEDDHLYLDRTTHAKKRLQGRGISSEMELLIEIFGEAEMQKGGTELLKIPTKVLKKLRKAIDKIENVTLVINPEMNSLITALHQDKKIRTTKNQ